MPPLEPLYRNGTAGPPRPEGNRSQGNRSQGNESQGNESQGNESQGNESQGNESQGNESQGNESQGNRSHPAREWKYAYNDLRVRLPNRRTQKRPKKHPGRSLHGLSSENASKD
ncbi:hypothetical protein Pla52o_37930 [Novipirellula galeiformis]|uniref:Uncharacterized protein n=1 Tax=Novipirellula galeiformis TaxID=2528004 RepID=A0A5C6CE83_9BACT|nr:hypothetical protein Pla52o_37930 [Novipirellula galeiformis]